MSNIDVLRKVRDDGMTVVMRNTRGEHSRCPASMTCYRIFLMGQQYTPAIPAGESLQPWESRL